MAGGIEGGSWEEVPSLRRRAHPLRLQGYSPHSLLVACNRPQRFQVRTPAAAGSPMRGPTVGRRWQCVNDSPGWLVGAPSVHTSLLELAEPPSTCAAIMARSKCSFSSSLSCHPCASFRRRHNEETESVECARRSVSQSCQQERIDGAGAWCCRQSAGWSGLTRKRIAGLRIGPSRRATESHGRRSR
jgi:hypothetical protein